MKITDEYGNKYTIDAPLSAGGQGAVFKVDENHKLLVKAIINANNKIIKNEKKYNEFEENVLQVEENVLQVVVVSVLYDVHLYVSHAFSKQVVFIHLPLKFHLIHSDTAHCVVE
jgi:hypothetical protein